LGPIVLAADPDRAESYFRRRRPINNTPPIRAEAAAMEPGSISGTCGGGPCVADAIAANITNDKNITAILFKVDSPKRFQIAPVEI
jgi:hypothetical protein